MFNFGIFVVAAAAAGLYGYLSQAPDMRDDETPRSIRFGKNLKALRDRADLTQRGLAVRLGLDSSSSISHWETGMMPSPTTIVRLARALRCAPADLLVGVATPYDVLRGQADLLGPGLLLSEEEEAFVRDEWRQLKDQQQAALRTIIRTMLEGRR